MARRCPMKRVQIGVNVTFGDCDKSFCEWWNSSMNECAVTSIGYAGFMLRKIKESIVEK